MPEYIDAEPLINWLKSQYKDVSLLERMFPDTMKGINDVLTAIVDKIEETEPADVAEVKHGRWRPKETNVGWGYVCSRCGAYERSAVKFCRHCGAIMDEDEDSVYRT